MMSKILNSIAKYGIMVWHVWYNECVMLLDFCNYAIAGLMIEKQYIN